MRSQLHRPSGLCLFSFGPGLLHPVRSALKWAAATAPSFGRLCNGPRKGWKNIRARVLRNASGHRAACYPYVTGLCIQLSGTHHTGIPMLQACLRARQLFLTSCMKVSTNLWGDTMPGLYPHRLEGALLPDWGCHVQSKGASLRRTNLSPSLRYAPITDSV